MKILFKGLFIIIGFARTAMAIPTMGFNGHMEQVRRNNPRIDDVVLSDGSIYRNSIREINGIIGREGIFPWFVSQNHNLNFLTPANWNFIVLSKYVENEFKKVEGGDCNSAGIDSLSSTLNEEYQGFERKIDDATKDVKRHCNFIDLYSFLNNARRDFPPLVHEEEQPNEGEQQQPDWTTETIVCLGGDEGVNRQYSLRNYPVEGFPNVTSGTHCNEVRVHPYEGYGQIGDGDFNAKIFMTPGLKTRIRTELGSRQSLDQNFIISIESPELYGNDTEHAAGVAALKPQWAFERFYDSNDVRSRVECWCKVFNLRDPYDIAKYFYFPPQQVSLHPEGRGALMRASNDTHHLGFHIDNTSRAILYNVRYIDGRIANTTKTGIIFVLSSTAQFNDFNTWLNLMPGEGSPQQTIAEKLRALADTCHWNGQSYVTVMNLLGISLP